MLFWLSGCDPTCAQYVIFSAFMSTHWAIRRVRRTEKWVRALPLGPYDLKICRKQLNSIAQRKVLKNFSLTLKSTSIATTHSEYFQKSRKYRISRCRTSTFDRKTGKITGHCRSDWAQRETTRIGSNFPITNIQSSFHCLISRIKYFPFSYQQHFFGTEKIEVLRKMANFCFSRLQRKILTFSNW